MAKPARNSARAREALQFRLYVLGDEMARVTGLEPATSGVTGRHSNQLSYTRVGDRRSGVGAV